MIQLFKSKTQNKQLLCNYGVFIINGMLALSIGSLLPISGIAGDWNMHSVE